MSLLFWVVTRNLKKSVLSKFYLVARENCLVLRRQAGRAAAGVFRFSLSLFLSQAQEQSIPRRKMAANLAYDSA